MAKIITVNESIKSNDDFELQIERKNLLNFRYSYKKSTKLKGIVFLIAGFGEDSTDDYINNLHKYTADTFDVLCVSVFYHCFGARLNNGAVFYPDEADKTTLGNYFQQYNIESESNSLDAILQKLNEKIQELKESGEVTQDATVAVPMTIMPAKEEYQNFGVLQALDHLNVLEFLQKSSLNFEKNAPVALVGSSHGGYIAHLCAKFAPNSIDLVIDNSSYIKPPYRYIVGKEYSHNIPECIASYKENIKLYGYTKTYWTLDKTSPYFFSNDRFRIRDIADAEHLEKLSQISVQKTKYISFHSAFDVIAPMEDKQLFYKNLNLLGFDATLNIIDNESYVDGKFIKNLEHGMNMSIKSLLARELPNIFKLQPKSKKIVEKISYPCDTLDYTFEPNGNFLHAKATPIEKEFSVEEVAKETFLQNIAYFEKNYSAIYKKLAGLDSAIEQGLYENRYDLIFENNYFDVIELSSNNRLYGSNSSDYATLAAKSINFSHDSNAFVTFRDTIISDEDLPKYQKMTMYENSISGYADILNYLQNHQSNKNIMKNIEKFIFFGVGLGTHIVEIDAKISAKAYLIVEDDLELFRLSLFTTPYQKLAEKSRLIFSIFDTKSEFLNKATFFLDIDFFRNHYLKYFHMLNHSEEKYQQFQIQIASQSHHNFFYNAILEQYLRPLEYIRQQFKFLDMLQKHEQKSLGKNPVLLLAAGPSLQLNMPWLRENHQKFIIVAVSAVLGILEKEGIKPDIAIHIDGFERSAILFEELNDITFFDETIFFLSARAPHKIVSMLKKESIFFFENGTSYKKELGNLSAFCVGSTTYFLLIALGVSELYLLGLDLALDFNTGKTHITNHPDSRSLNISKNLDELDIITFRDTVITVEGNLRPTVFTTPDFAYSIDVINTVSTGFKEDKQHVYNLSDGAKFNNTVATQTTFLEMNSFATIDKKILHVNIENEFNEKSSNCLSDNEFNEIVKRILNAKSIKSTLESWQESEFTTSKEFLESLGTLIQQLCSSSSNDSYDLALIYQEYLKIVSPYIFDFFNHEISDDANIFVKKIQIMLCVHLLEIVNLYIDGLEK